MVKYLAGSEPCPGTGITRQALQSFWLAHCRGQTIKRAFNLGRTIADTALYRLLWARMRWAALRHTIPRDRRVRQSRQMGINKTTSRQGCHLWCATWRGRRASWHHVMPVDHPPNSQELTEAIPFQTRLFITK